MASSRRRRMGAVEEAEESDERWLLTYADMITLLMALFMVLFSISSVNVSKFVTLQRSLQDAFSGRILPGGRALQESGGDTTSPKVAATPPTTHPAVTSDGAGKADAKARPPPRRPRPSRRTSRRSRRASTPTSTSTAWPAR